MGIYATAVLSVIISYQAFFPRVNRPDYSLIAGAYCYERITSKVIREEKDYFVKGVRLRGYFYKAIKKDLSKNKAIVVVSHGMNSGADDCLPIIEYMVKVGFNVFSYDCTGTYGSEGNNTVGACQSLIDLEGTINYLSNSSEFKDFLLLLFGYSWGGYACASVLQLSSKIMGCASVSAMNNATQLMVEEAEKYVGKICYFSAHIFNAYQRLLFNDYAGYSAISGINCRKIPVLIAHGEKDKRVSFNKQSIISKKKDIINPFVCYYVGKNEQGDHGGILLSKRAVSYRMKVKNDLKKMQKQNGKKLNKKQSLIIGLID